MLDAAEDGYSQGSTSGLSTREPLSLELGLHTELLESFNALLQSLAIPLHLDSVALATPTVLLTVLEAVLETRIVDVPDGDRASWQRSKRTAVANVVVRAISEVLDAFARTESVTIKPWRLEPVDVGAVVRGQASEVAKLVDAVLRIATGFGVFSFHSTERRTLFAPRPLRRPIRIDSVPPLPFVVPSTRPSLMAELERTASLSPPPRMPTSPHRRRHHHQQQEEEDKEEEEERTLIVGRYRNGGLERTRSSNLAAGGFTAPINATESTPTSSAREHRSELPERDRAQDDVFSVRRPRRRERDRLENALESTRPGEVTLPREGGNHDRTSETIRKAGDGPREVALRQRRRQRQTDRSRTAKEDGSNDIASTRTRRVERAAASTRVGKDRVRRDARSASSGDLASAGCGTASSSATWSSSSEEEACCGACGTDLEPRPEAGLRTARADAAMDGDSSKRAAARRHDRQRSISADTETKSPTLGKGSIEKWCHCRSKASPCEDEHGDEGEDEDRVSSISSSTVGKNRTLQSSVRPRDPGKPAETERRSTSTAPPSTPARRLRLERFHHREQRGIGDDPAQEELRHLSIHGESEIERFEQTTRRRHRHRLRHRPAESVPAALQRDAEPGRAVEEPPSELTTHPIPRTTTTLSTPRAPGGGSQPQQPDQAHALVLSSPSPYTVLLLAQRARLAEKLKALELRERDRIAAVASEIAVEEARREQQSELYGDAGSR